MAKRTDFLVDTNFVIYYLEGSPSVFGYELYGLAVSVITELELLVKPDLSVPVESSIRRFLEECPAVQLTPAIQAQTIKVARRYRLKLPDAIIAATALDAGLPLVTADRHFSRVDGLNLLLLELE